MAGAREPGHLKSLWSGNRALPGDVAALLDSLRFSEKPAGGPAADQGVRPTEYFDRNQLTLLLQLPGSAANLARNQERVSRIKKAFWDVSAALGAANIEFAVLKGFAHWDRFTRDPALRMQYDLDLFCPHAAAEARDESSYHASHARRGGIPRE